MAENTACIQEQRVEVERKPDQVTQTYNIGYRNIEFFPDIIRRIVYKQNIICDERFEIEFDGERRFGEVTRYGDEIHIEPDFSDIKAIHHLSTNERLKNIPPDIMREILNQLSPEAKSFLEKALE